MKLNNKKILVAKGYSKFEVLRKAADEIIKGFEQKGYKVTVADIPKQGSEIFIEEIFKPYSFVFSCQAIGFDSVYDDGISLLQRIENPYIGWIFDDCMYHEKRVEHVHFNHVYLFVVNGGNIDVIQTLYPNAKNLFYFPHGGFEGKSENKTKDIEVLFSGNLGKKPVLEEIIPDAMPVEKFLIQESIKLLQKKPQTTVRQAVKIVLENVGESMSAEILRELDRVIYYLDLYVRYECKYKILEALLRNQISVHLIGEGSEELIQAYPEYAIVHGGMDIEEVISYMERARIVINPVSTFEQGMHERILTAMLNEAVCFTPENEYLQSVFGNRLEYINLINLDTMIERIRYILKEYEVYRKEIFKDNASYAKENHTWKKRGEQIVEFYENQINN